MVIALTADVNAASQMRRAAQDGYGSKTEVAALRQDVCFAPVSGHRQAVSACPKMPIAVIATVELTQLPVRKRRAQKHVIVITQSA